MSYGRLSLPGWLITVLTVSTLFGQDGGVGRPIANGVQVTVELKPGHGRTKWMVDFAVQNDRPEAVYVTIDPVRSNGDTGYYFQHSKTNPTQMEITSQLYSLPPYFLYGDKASVRLVRLESKQKHTGTLSLELPPVETMPPYRERPERTKLDTPKMQEFRVGFGILPDDSAVNELLSKKVGGPLVNGSDVLRSGRSGGQPLIELQTIVWSKEVQLSQN